ncbi:MAG: hypothetical protein R2710_29705 [Acidimicrobiales bacterium]
MSTVVALGESHELDGYALAGARVVRSHSATQLVEAFEALEEEVGLVLLTRWSADILRDQLSERPRLLQVVLP